MKLKNLLLAATLLLPAHTSAQGAGNCEEYRLDNGLTVILLEDTTATDVHGVVAVRAGKADETEDGIGAASLLRLLLENGTERIGALDPGHEQPLLEEISRLYDSLAVERDPARRADLDRRINTASAEAAQYAVPTEYGRLMRRIGATETGSEVSWDGSLYWSSFPKESAPQWLELNSERFIKPVFRNFRGTLNLLIEEYNRREHRGLFNQEIPERPAYEDVYRKLYGGTPYARADHGSQYGKDIQRLTPSAAQEFYDRWYAANNMVLVLAGNFDADTVKPLIARTFGRLEQRELPARETYPAPDLSGGKLNLRKLDSSIEWYFNAAKGDDADFIPLLFSVTMLSNWKQTGLLDSIVRTRDRIVFSGTGYTYLGRMDGGIASVKVKLYNDIDHTLAGNRLREVRKMIYGEIDRLKDESTIPDLLFDAVKRMHLDANDFDRATTSRKVRSAAVAFTRGIGMETLLGYGQQLRDITKADVARCARRYFTDKCLTVVTEYSFDRSTTDIAMIEKAATETPDYPDTAVSAFGRKLAEDRALPEEPHLPDSSSNVDKPIGEFTALHYTPNRRDGRFSLSLRYYYGRRDNKLIEYMADLLHISGIGTAVSGYRLKQMLSALGSEVRFMTDNNYFYIEITGDDMYLDQTLALVTAMVRIPMVDEEVIDMFFGGEYGRRNNQWDSRNHNGYALDEYVIFGNGSKYIDRLPPEALLAHRLSDDKTYYEGIYLYDNDHLTNVISDAISRPVDIFYYGSRPLEDVECSFQAIPRFSYIQNTAHPQRRELMDYKKTGVMFYRDNRSPYAKAYFYVKMDAPDVAGQVRCQALNMYFSILLNEELRRKRTLDISPEGGIEIPPYMGGVAYFHGEVETGHRNMNEAVDIYMDMLDSLPERPEEFDGIVRTLYASYMKSDPDMRRQSMSYEVYKQVYPDGFPLDIWLAELRRLTYKDMMDYYRGHIKGRPVTIAIMGNPKKMDLGQLREKYGKVKWVMKNDLFVDSFSDNLL